MMKSNFIKCGITGWCLEIMFTSLESIKNHDIKFMGHSSILMFPIYGMGAFLFPVAKLLEKQKFWIRGGVYSLLIFTAEYISGSFLKQHRMCPWDYSKCKTNINGLVRLDFAPLWFGVGLLFEQIIRKR